MVTHCFAKAVALGMVAEQWWPRMYPPVRHTFFCTCLVTVNLLQWGNITVQGIVALEPLPSVCQHEGVFVPRGVLDPHHRHALVQVVNPGTKDLRLAAELVLADQGTVDVLDISEEGVGDLNAGSVLQEDLGDLGLPEHLLR
jgi:hypothetical protein